MGANPYDRKGRFAMKGRLLTVFVVVTSLLLAIVNGGFGTSPGGKWR
jgi:hypothetical protein